MKQIDIVAIYNKEEIIQYLIWLESLLDAGECKALLGMIPVVENGEYMIVASRNFATKNFIISCSTDSETKDLYVSSSALALRVSSKKGKKGKKAVEVPFDKDLGQAVDRFLNKYRERFGDG